MTAFTKHSNASHKSCILLGRQIHLCHHLHLKWVSVHCNSTPLPQKPLKSNCATASARIVRGRCNRATCYQAEVQVTVAQACCLDVPSGRIQMRSQGTVIGMQNIFKHRKITIFTKASLHEASSHRFQVSYRSRIWLKALVSLCIINP